MLTTKSKHRLPNIRENNRQNEPCMEVVRSRPFLGWPGFAACLRKQITMRIISMK